MAVETELRFRLTAAQARAIAADARFAGGLQRQPLTSIYFDTPELDLAGQRVGLRLRRVGRVWLQTLKCALPDAQEHQRGEWEWPVARAVLDFSKLAQTPMADWFDKPRHRELLAPRFETRFARSTALVEFDATSIEVAIDRGRISAGTESVPILELELELKAGPIAGLYGLARALNQDHALMPEPRSKAARGFALVTGSAPAPSKSGRLALDADASTEAAFARVIGHCLAHLQANAGGALAGEDPEYVHQARVALRRLRSALTVFRRAIPREASAAIGAEARALASSMGAARDLDVFEDETLKPLIAEGHGTLLEPLRAALSTERELARRTAAAAMAPPRYTAFVLDALQWIDDCGWRGGAQPAAEAARLADRREMNVQRFAAAALERRHRAVLVSAVPPSALAVPARHELRIAVKKLRYAAEFFGSLFPGRGSAPYLDAMARLQQALGILNDVATGEQLVQSRLSEGIEPAALALLAGWRSGLAQATLHEADRAWQAFGQVERFW
jgi:triphosphatase